MEVYSYTLLLSYVSNNYDFNKKKRLQIFVPLLSLIFVSKPKHCTFQTEIELLISEDVFKNASPV